MKNRFNTIDTIAIAIELQKIKDSRVNQVYDVDHKTYLIKLNGPDSSKITLLFESGIRIHTTKCDWPKNSTPSGFTMKLRKHIRNKRIIKVEQLGCDRIIDIQFGTGEAAYHLILEFFNRGNIVLTDYEYKIVSLLRMYSDGENHHFAPKEAYPIDRARDRNNLTIEDLESLLKKAKKNEQIRKCLLPSVDFGLSFLEHCLRKVGLNPDMKIASPSIVEEIHEQLVKLVDELATADAVLTDLQTNGPKGYISCINRKNEQGQEFKQMIEFNPYAFIQNQDFETMPFDTFTDAVDEYFSKMESQKLELSVIEKETEAMRKVNKIRADQESRLQELSQKQLYDKVKAERIMNNADTVEEAINIIRTCLAHQMSWGSIIDVINEAKKKNDPIGSLISNTKFEVNMISMSLSDPFADSDDENTPIEVDIDLSLSAHANATRYYDNKKHAAIKEKKTLESQKKALKSAEKKAREMIKTVKTQVAITVSRKVYWFEKFFWFISSDNYLVIGGRDQKQNELIVKRYMKTGDLYVHADLIGASSIVIKNPSGAPVPPRTLDEAGHMAVCYSNAWDTKIICRAWWVYEHQVSKTAPSGEYLVTGSFMIRGQKNFLLPTHLQLGFSFLFKIDESSAFRHADERKPKLLMEESSMERKPENPVDELVEELEDVDIDSQGSSDSESRSPSPEKNSDSTFLSGIIPTPELNNERNIDMGNALVISLKDDKSKEPLPSPQTKISDNENDESLQALEISMDSAVTRNRPLSEILEATEGAESISRHESINILKDLKKLNPPSNVGKKTAKDDDKKRKVEKDDKKRKDENDDKTGVLNAQQGKLKRGQKSKLKKIKEKYKDQDEEEKQLRMSILQSAGSSKKSGKKGSKSVQNQDKQAKKTEKSVPSKKSNIETMKDLDPAILEIEGEQPDREVSTELDMLSLLTGQPHPEDELVYALPVVAPYNSVLNNKFKMKIVPGTSKRGKAARVALEYFLRLKECTSNEKDLLKCVHDQSLSRNFPGKVKLLSAQLKKK